LRLVTKVMMALLEVGWREINEVVPPESVLLFEVGEAAAVGTVGDPAPPGPALAKPVELGPLLLEEVGLREGDGTGEAEVVPGVPLDGLEVLGDGDDVEELPLPLAPELVMLICEDCARIVSTS